MLRVFQFNGYDRIFSLGYDESSHEIRPGSATLDNSQALGKFLSGMERRAFRRAQIATANREDALDIVQDTMVALVSKYAHKDPADWELLFHRILSRRIIDWHRHNKIRQKLTFLFSSESDTDEVTELQDQDAPGPEQHVQIGQSMQQLDALLQELPLRQQQVFLLRAWEGLNEKETAKAMACSVGTVKTHYSRARAYLKARIEEA